MAATLNPPGIGTVAPGMTPRARFVLISCLVGLCGIIGGALSASGRPQLSLIFFGLILVVLVISSRISLFWVTAIGGLVVTGACQLYLPESRYVRYVVPFATAPLLLHWAADSFRHRLARTELGVPLPPHIWWAFAFILVSMVSVLVNLSDLLVALVGIKDYFQMWALFLALAFLRWSPSFGRNLWRGLLLIGLLQIPFALQQHLYLVPQRMGLGNLGVVPADVVAGTFGAYLMGGGANAALAAFEVVLVGIVLAMWKKGLFSIFRTAVLSLLLLSPMLVNEAKIAVVYVIMVFCIVFRKDIIERPLRFVTAGLGIFGLVALLMTGILLTQPSGKFHGWSDLVDYVVERQTASQSEREGPYTQLSRLTVISFWAKEHVAANPINTLFGHGLGQSREPEAGRGGVLSAATTLAEKRYPGLNIGYTAVAALLWDTGLVGLGVVLAMFLAAFNTARWLSHYYRERDRFKSALFDGLQAGVAVLTLSLAHKDFFVVHLPYQTFVYLVLGYIAYERLQVSRLAASGRA